MARPSKHPDEVRQYQLSVRFSAKERKQLAQIVRYLHNLSGVEVTEAAAVRRAVEEMAQSLPSKV